jgi:hydroxymethylpyrimidine/phosphomethylpyrimidine kinase
VEREFFLATSFNAIFKPSRADPSLRGLEADQKVIAAHGCYAMTATTALTAQNTLGIVDIHYTPPEFVRKLIKACISDVGVDVVKTGIALRFHYAISKLLFILSNR